MTRKPQENNIISFVLPICPQAIQAGNRIGIRRGGKAIIFSSKRKKGYQMQVKMAAMPHRPAQPFAGPVRLDLTFILPRPKSLMRKSHPDGWIPHTKRPDRDNLVKGTQDGLSAAGFWVDDAQVFDGRVAKYYAERGGKPRIIVAIEEVRQP
jgi:Holliday junction resolvase RusA-like endonuclease